MLAPILFVTGISTLLLGYFLYGLAVRRHLVEPNFASWLIWGTTTATEAFTYNAINDGALQNIVFLLSSIACIGVTISVWQHAKWHRPSITEWLCISTCIAALIIWLGFQNAIWAHGLVLAMIPVSFLPTWIDVRTDPSHEQSPAWGLWSLADASTLGLILISSENQGKELPYILIEFACHASVWWMIGFKTINPFKTFCIIGRKFFLKTIDLNSGHSFLIGRNHVGKAIHAGQTFKQGQAIVLFRGPIIHQDLLPPYLYKAADRFFQIDKTYFMGPSGGVDDLINHSCDPNTGLQFTKQGPLLVALKPIEIGDELTWDYSTTIMDHDWSMTCQCGSYACRGIIGEFETIPKPIQRAYAELGILPSYIVDSMTVRST
jgi:hypothetical protein